MLHSQYRGRFWTNTFSASTDTPLTTANQRKPEVRAQIGKDKIRITMQKSKLTMGVIVGNRGFFPDHLAKSGREEIHKALGAAGMNTVALGPEESKFGAVETHEEAKRCAALFRK